MFIDSQVPIGDAGKSTKGKKIADYLFKHAMTNNAALVDQEAQYSATRQDALPRGRLWCPL